jgi:hypothetical protein
MLRRCEECGRHLTYTGHALYRYTGSMILTQALKENMGDPERETCRESPETSPEGEASRRRTLTSFQEVGLDHSSVEVW